MLAALLAVPAWAWDDAGHRLVGMIAWNRMRPATRTALRQILRHHPWGNITLAEACTCPDHPHLHDTWHWTNVPFFDGVPARAVRVPEHDCLWALRHNLESLKNRRLPGAERAMALSWLGHLAGDVHQPLHVSSRYSANGPENGDKGGNTFMLDNISLHFYWDTAGGKFLDPQPLEQMAARMSAGTPPPRAHELDGRIWVRESYDFVLQLYAGVEEGESPTPAYQAWAQEVSMARLRLAGFRLARLLDNAFPGRTGYGQEQHR